MDTSQTVRLSPVAKLIICTRPAGIIRRSHVTASARKEIISMNVFLEVMNQRIPVLQYLEFFVRILLACGCGAIIGVERSHRLKEAGVRTHLLVCCASALLIIISKYGFADMTDAEGNPFFGTRGSDRARIAAQVVSGISFLCAGVIFKQGSVIKGLTTAAGLWATAGIGLAFGAGLFPLGIFVTILVLLIQIIMHRFPVFNDHYQNNCIEITVKDNSDFRSAWDKQLEAWHAQVLESTVSRNQDGTTSYTMTVKMHASVKQDEIYSFLDQNASVLSFRQKING